MTGDMRDRDEADPLVGPVLIAGELAATVVAAIRALNHDVIVRDRGSYLRVLVPRRCVVTRQAIERELRHEFRLPGDLEQIMPSFKGLLRMDAEQVVWSSEGS